MQTPAVSDSLYYEYDGENRQVRFKHGAALEGEYGYDGEGRRVKKVDYTGAQAVTTVFVYDAVGRLVAEYSDPAPSSGGGVNYLTADALGSTRVVTDGNGGVRSRHDYVPFGQELKAGLVESGRSGGQGYETQGQASKVRQKFTGKERDSETGLDYFQARYYSNLQGRFTSVDPENYQGMRDPSDPQSWNAYAYVNNNPLRRIDPDGRGFWENLGNWLRYGVWGNEQAVQAQENERRQDLLQEADQNGALIIQNVSGQWVRIYPGQLTRAQVWAWSSLLYYYQETGGGRQQLTPEEMASVIDATRMGSPALKDDPYHPDNVTKRQDTELKDLRQKMQSVDRAAERLGFNRTVKDAPFNSHGQKVFTDGKGRYITRDIDSHSGGAWKMFDRSGNRLGTYDANLNRIGN